jgi:hypothetical protein
MPWSFRGSGHTDPPFLTSTLDGGDSSASSPCLFTSGERDSNTHRIGDCVGPEMVWTLWRREKSCTSRELNPCCPPGSPSVYRLSYPDSFSVHNKNNIRYVRAIKWRNLTYSRYRLKPNPWKAKKEEHILELCKVGLGSFVLPLFPVSYRLYINCVTVVWTEIGTIQCTDGFTSHLSLYLHLQQALHVAEQLQPLAPVQTVAPPALSGPGPVKHPRVVRELEPNVCLAQTVPGRTW